MEETTQPTPTMDPQIRQKIVEQCCEQIRTSRQFKLTRMAQIKENENLYYGIIEKSIRNPFNENFPFMSGYVDFLRSRIDDDSTLQFTHQAESDLKRANKINGFYDTESKSIDPDASWDLKHRHAKFNAILSGVAIYSYYSYKNPEYKSCMEVISHYDFHNEPRGGAILEKHLFCGQDNIFKNEESLPLDPSYDQEKVKQLIAEYGKGQYKDNTDLDNNRNNRYTAMGQDPQTNNFVGQKVIKFAQFYTTYENKRYYVLFNEVTKVAIRVCPIEEMFPSGLYPYVTWHTNEDPDLFWSKAPADDARATARILNLMINQELYNRQKRNYGKIGYDVTMFPNVQALIDSRPDSHIPMDLSNGKQISQGLYEFKVGDLNGTLDLVTWLDQFTGKQIGRTASAAGQAESDKKVGIFKGEIEQIDQLINVKNKSYRYGLSCLGLRFKQGLDDNLTKEVSIKIMGAKGVEWDTLSPADLKTDKDLIIQPVGGSTEIRLKELQDNKKATALSLVQTVNPQWKDRELLLLSGYTSEDAKDAFSANTFSEKELMSEASQSEKDIVEGKNPPINHGADDNFIEHILNFEKDTNDLKPEIRKALINYAMAHIDISIENGINKLQEIKRKRMMTEFAAPPVPMDTPPPTSTPAI